MNGISLTPKSENRLSLIYSRIACCRSLDHFLTLFSVFMTHEGFLYRVGLSKLNFHKCSHNFSDTINPMCPINEGLEDTEHFILSCHSFEEQRRDLLACVIPVLHSFEFTNVPNPIFLQILLYGDKKLPFEVDEFILEATILFISRRNALNDYKISFIKYP